MSIFKISKSVAGEHIPNFVTWLNNNTKTGYVCDTLQIDSEVLVLTVECSDPDEAVMVRER